METVALLMYVVLQYVLLAYIALLMYVVFQAFMQPVTWGIDLATEHERWLTDEVRIPF